MSLWIRSAVRWRAWPLFIAMVAGSICAEGDHQHKLSEHEKQCNRNRSKIRSRVERVFGVQAQKSGQCNPSDRWFGSGEGGNRSQESGLQYGPLGNFACHATGEMYSRSKKEQMAQDKTKNRRVRMKCLLQNSIQQARNQENNLTLTDLRLIQGSLIP